MCGEVGPSATILVHPHGRRRLQFHYDTHEKLSPSRRIAARRVTGTGDSEDGKQYVSSGSEAVWAVRTPMYIGSTDPQASVPRSHQKEHLVPTRYVDPYPKYCTKYGVRSTYIRVLLRMRGSDHRRHRARAEGDGGG